MPTAARFFRASLLGTLAICPLAHAAPIRCTPAVQYDCSQERCTRTTEGFQHAESFSWDAASGTLTACLWSQCFSAKQKLLRSTVEGETSVVGELEGESPNTSTPPLLVSLTIDAKDKFVAIWSYRGAGLTFDQGRCQR